MASIYQYFVKYLQISKSLPFESVTTNIVSLSPTLDSGNKQQA